MTLQVVLMSEHLLRRDRRLTYVQLQGRLFDLLKEYCDGHITTSQRLRKCGPTYAPPAVQRTF